MYCGSSHTKKKGLGRGVQRYLCLDCKKQFQSKRRPKKLEQVIWSKYVHQRQTLKDLAQDYGHSINWIRAKIKQAEAQKRLVDPCGLVMVADATFFNQFYGFIVFRAPKIQKNLYFKAIAYETINEYRLGREAVERLGFKLSAITLDGRSGVRNVFVDIPVQMCHFHQKKIVQRYLTLKPKLEASLELKAISDTLVSTDEATFPQALEAWHRKWQNFLKERTTDLNTGKWYYTHRKTRSAYHSLKKNLPYLFTYLKYPELNIPNTTNSLDGSFNHLKGLVGVHRGFNQQLKEKIIEEILGK